ncbi:MAG: hypothetical protein AB7I18_04675 [Candidatus Berkiella sp.]
MLQKLGLGRKDKTHRTSDPKVPELPELPPEPFHSERRYSTQELLCVFEYAQDIDFSGIKAFKEEESSDAQRDLFINIILMNLPSNAPDATGATMDISEVNVDSDAHARVSLNLPAKSIPYIITTIIKRGMINWDFFDKKDDIARNLLENFKSDFIAALEKVNSKNKKLTIGFTQLDRFTSTLLSPLSQNNNPKLMHTTAMILINFITALTTHGYTEEAKVLHTFLALCKKIILQAAPTAEEYERNVRLLALPLLRALRVTSEVDVSLTPLMTCLLNLTLEHPLFNEAYDIDTYLMIYRIHDQATQLGIDISTNPSLFERGANLPINQDIVKDYRTLVEALAAGKHDKDHCQQLLLAFFRKIIARYCQFNKGTKAQDIHNFLYMLLKAYEGGKHHSQEQKLYAKLLRMFLHIPTATPELDHLFDSQAIRLILAATHEHDFSHPFDIANYDLTLADARHYCQQLQSRFQDAQTELHELHDQISSLQGLLNGREEDCSRLASELAKMRLAEEYSPQGSPQSSPPSSPPKERMKTRRHPTKKESHPPILPHTKSESDIKRPNRRLT